MENSWWLCSLVMTSLVLSPCRATTDPLTYLCDPICWEEEDLSDQCLQDRCSSLNVRSRPHRRCRNECWNLVAACRLWCGQHALSVLGDCQGTCSPEATNAVSDSSEEGGTASRARGAGRRVGDTLVDTSGDCEWACYTHDMLLLKRKFDPSDQPYH